MAGNQTVTTGNVFRPNIWAADVLDALKANIILKDRVRHYDSEIKTKGQSVEVPIAPNLVANAKVANTPVTLQNNTATKVSILIDKHYESSVLIEDILEIQSAYDLRREFAASEGIAIAEQVDTDIYTELALTAQEVGVAGAALTDTTILAARTTLNKAKAPMRDRTLAVSPAAEADLLAIDKYVRYDALGTGKAIVNGKIGTIYNFDVVMSTIIADGVSVAFHKEAVGIAIQKEPRVQSEYSVKDLGSYLTTDVLYGVKTLRPTFAVKVFN